jgi:hypothetical protein
MAAPKGNKYWMLAAFTGRPPKYETPDEMLAKVTEYFTKCFKRGKYTPTISGLTYFLGFESRASLDDYCKKSEEFSYIIHHAKRFIENCYENQLYTNASGGAVFALKNMGWKDKTETEITTNGETLDLSKLTDEELEILERAGIKQNKGREV